MPIARLLELEPQDKVERFSSGFDGARNLQLSFQLIKENVSRSGVKYEWFTLNPFIMFVGHSM